MSGEREARERTTEPPEALGGAPAGDELPDVEAVPSAKGAAGGEPSRSPDAGEPPDRGAAPEPEPGAPTPAGEDPAPAPARAREPKGPPPPPERLEGAVEALLLSAGETLTAERIRDVLGLPSAVHVREALAAIRARWQAAGTAVEIQDVAGGHRVVTRPEYAEYVRRLQRRPTADRLSPSLLETLSIVAYRQPVARAEVERIRGVQCGEALRGLLDRRLVKVAGRSDQPGRPLLYATTTRFLETFGISTLEDLPNAKDLSRL